jgi:DnaJ-class molecular chaperone
VGANHWYGRIAPIDTADPKEYFKTLGLHPLSAQILSDEQFTKLLNCAYRLFSQVHHPDKGGDLADLEQMKRVNLAREVLRDPKQRRAYSR